MGGLAILLGVIGLAVGSFIGLVSLRLPQGGAIVWDRSRCGGCGRVLNGIDLLPLLGFLLRRGACQSCHAIIPRRYPAIELAAGLIGGASGWWLPGSEAIAGALLGWALLLLAILDAEHYWLPDMITLPLIATGLGFHGWIDPAGLQGAAIGAAVGFVSLWSISRLYKLLRGQMGLGGGDPKLFAAAGAWLGWEALPMVLLASALLGLLAALVLKLVGRKLHWTSQLPFGTCLAMPIWIAFLLRV